MRLRPSLLFLLLIVPGVEVLLFVIVGSRIGIGYTVTLVVSTALVGGWLVSYQGRATLFEARRDVAAGMLPARSLVHGVILLISGVLLLTPGFFSDLIGFVLLVPSVREAVRRWASTRFHSETTIIS